MDELFQEIREAGTPRAWSKGVQLARGAAVALEEEADGEVRLHVEGRAGGRAQRVQLYPDDLEWACNCGGEDDPCEHVAAAVIAARQAGGFGKLPRREAPAEARVGYRLHRTPQGLTLDRVAVVGTRELPLGPYPLAAVKDGRGERPPLTVGAADREVDRALGTRFDGSLPRGVLARVLGALSTAGDVRLDGAPVHASGRAVGLVARVRDRGSGFVVDVVQDPAIEEVFANGAVRIGDRLHPVGEAPVGADELPRLKAGVVFERADVARLVSEVLPDLESRLPVEVQTKRLPGLTHVAPALRVETERRGGELHVLPLLVYGDPPVARVDAGRLVPVGDGRSLPVRDEAAERRLVHALRNELGLEPGRRARYTGLEAMQIAERLERWDGEVRGEAHTAFFRAPELEASVRILGDAAGGDFEARFESKGRGSVSPRAVVEAWLAGEDYVTLDGGGVAPLPADWMAKFGPILADLLAAKGDREALPPAALPDLGRLAQALDQPPPPALDRLRALLEADGPLPEPTLPTDLTADLRPYQHDGVRWLSFLRRAGLGGLLADDMGLGKTLQALAVVEGRTLVVAPTSVLHNWADEAARFRPGLKVCVYHGPTRALDPAADLTLTTYAVLRNDADTLGAVPWEMVVLDEAQAIKNPDSQTARAAFGLEGGFKVALTGTPVENRLEELWSQLHFAAPGLLGGRSDFAARYAKPVAAGEPGVAARLRARIRPFLLRRRKDEVARDLPPRTDQVLRCTLSEDERAVYQAIHAATREEVVARLSEGGNVLAALEALLRLRQAASHPGLLPGRDAVGSSKVELLMETLDEALSEGHKALVFSQWTSLLDLVEPHLAAAGVPFGRLDGSTPDRGAVVRRFQEGEDWPVLLVSLKAGGTGLNLTAADHVFLMDPWWNPAVEDQAADRAHRIGQERPVMVHKLVAEDTVDERILALQESKRALADAALGEADAAASLTREDLLALLD